MTNFHPIRTWPKETRFQQGDLVVIFGEVFSRGYVNGLIDEAVSAGCEIVYSTVGRREAGALRPLNADELKEKNQENLINIPLEAGFDLEPDENGATPVDQLKEYGLTGWESAKLNWDAIEQSRLKGRERFRKYTTQFLQQLERYLRPGRNVLFVHTMAGGFPRAKVVMPIANRVFKGTGNRFQSSQVFWDSEIGRLCDLSFREVTAETFRHLIDLSHPLRAKIEASGGKARYVAYGYHGNEVLCQNEYTWYSYSPYLQGFAKIALEEIAKESWQKGAKATVFNVPEILTNSSSIFLGIEVVLYPLLKALRKEGSNSKQVQDLAKQCQSLLKDGVTVHDIDKVTDAYLTNPMVRAWPKFETWPQHNGPEQMAAMIDASEKIIEMHKDPKNLMTATLSEIVFRATGNIMFREMYEPREPVLWIGHDAVAKATIGP